MGFYNINKDLYTGLIGIEDIPYCGISLNVQSPVLKSLFKSENPNIKSSEYIKSSINNPIFT